MNVYRLHFLEGKPTKIVSRQRLTHVPSVHVVGILIHQIVCGLTGIVVVKIGIVSFRIFFRNHSHASSELLLYKKMHIRIGQ